MAARQHFQHHVPVSSDQPQQRCARGAWCTARTRDAEAGEWHAALATQPLCPTDQAVMVTYLAELPPMHERLAELSLSPARRTRPVRTSPGSRVLVSTEALALMSDMAAQLGVWAARVRDVPQLSLSRPAAPFGSQARIEADCGVLAAHPGPMLALPPKDMIRTWWFTPPRDAVPPGPVPCRRCGIRVTLSPSRKLWWPARCTHSGPLIPAGERDAETGKDTLLACAACGARLPPGRRTPPPCRHEAAAPAAPVPGGPVPADVEEEIAGLEVVRVGYDWVQCLTPLGGTAAALDAIDLRNDAYRLLREAPAAPDLLDGVPCRACDAMSSLEALPAAQPDPSGPEPDFSQCSRCRDRMTRPEYRQWVAQYEAYAKAAGLPSCRRCAGGDHASCQWKACPCRATDPARHAGKAA